MRGAGSYGYGGGYGYGGYGYGGYGDPVADEPLPSGRRKKSRVIEPVAAETE